MTKTIRKGIIDPTPIVDQPEVLVFGMLAALLATAIWLLMASLKGWPVSTTHSIIGEGRVSVDGDVVTIVGDPSAATGTLIWPAENGG